MLTTVHNTSFLLKSQRWLTEVSLQIQKLTKLQDAAPPELKGLQEDKIVYVIKIRDFFHIGLFRNPRNTYNLQFK